MIRLTITAALCLTSALIGAACAQRDEKGPPPDSAVHSATADSMRPGAETVRARPESATALASRTIQPGALATVLAESVQNWTGPGKQPFEVARRTADPTSALARRFGTITLTTSLRARAPNVGQYPCTSCHLGRRMILNDDTRIADAHQNIKPVHPAQTGAACSTCHAPDNVELLALKSGERATLDHAYRLCAQCHFAQADAWAGGGHGKRLDGWQGRRVVMGCADCHDPHSPVLTPRTPFRAPILQRTRSSSHEP